ncbi:glycoside hydrolase family 19 protein [Mesorhizobium sp. M7A.F.Ca.CA.004.02.1.1]|uniref:glycoside hydrolase family 19 protein n=1 Tax=Mesorhizobium sp. M7A.F.Ca.CA.004.02.1.1 TaxID=2496690 RepID=UPI000FCA3FA4|nr:glycoside hydrolase family 19 protein [Mesorhizobium sp. M7A.F.Ca.CA.004.02.1.1]RVB05697.1 hypothetical protein EN912_02220 [Mesorhizobium sp. M7A.F.Ca.CA.004.02.1.1]
MNRTAFYALVRAAVGGLVASQVAGFEAILNEAERRHTKLDSLAYILATPWHETGYTMQPIAERGGPSYCAKYDSGNLAKMLGNTAPGDGYRFRGRGYVQLTGRRNYWLASTKIGVDLIKNPDQAMNLEIATRVLFEGMEAGWFTGKSLNAYLDHVDEGDQEDLREFVSARRIINGTDKALKIGQHALVFEAALKAAGYAA